MQPHIRAIVAASVHAFVTGRKVAGLYDQSTARHLRIAAEARGPHLQGYDGERNAKFGGTLPELLDTGADAAIHMEVEDDAARGYDRSSSSHFTAKVADQMVQLYDHADGAWFTFEMQSAPPSP
ncbi:MULTISPECIES: hypothetical protein [unclassified Sphingomonas]|uniref:hypothetical protein n=1 Tax=unclassified Sphingomonas TaxID=196159 RepID=UPI0028599BF5|nr:MULTISPECIES: hypothetical protein [unclassified Sphingomonas]MDR6114705.1 hypothetical protein [Sphingomonas sp. SORGH_AS_0789]MDR6151622.1 hypothetical protein [Sphingomonas sp. SORGH_AS_0742]